MELKSLILGLIFSLGIFALKSGAGLSYRLRQEKTIMHRLAIMVIFALVYGLVFVLAEMVSRSFGTLEHLDSMLVFVQHGMTLHFILAGLLLAWGTVLLKKRAEDSGYSHAWLLLILPCPICFTVIIFSGSFLANLFPDVEWLFPALAAGFVTFAFITAVLMACFANGDGRQNLGMMMVMVALYFLLSIMIIPQFADIDRIYRLSLGSVVSMDGGNLPLLFVGVSLLFTSSFIKSYWSVTWK